LWGFGQWSFKYWHQGPIWKLKSSSKSL
jgi:hypothetical protein